MAPGEVLGTQLVHQKSQKLEWPHLHRHWQGINVKRLKLEESTLGTSTEINKARMEGSDGNISKNIKSILIFHHMHNEFLKL